MKYFFLKILSSFRLTPNHRLLPSSPSIQSNVSIGNLNPGANNLEFSYSALSLGMNTDDLLFNLYYFGAGESRSNFQLAYNTAIEETIAAHSASNTYVL